MSWASCWLEVSCQPWRGCRGDISLGALRCPHTSALRAEQCGHVALAPPALGQPPRAGASRGEGGCPQPPASSAPAVLLAASEPHWVVAKKPLATGWKALAMGWKPWATGQDCRGQETERLCPPGLPPANRGKGEPQGRGQERFWAAVSAQLLEIILRQQHPWQGMASYLAKFAPRQKNLPRCPPAGPTWPGLEQLPLSEAGCARGCSSRPPLGGRGRVRQSTAVAFNSSKCVPGVWWASLQMCSHCPHLESPLSSIQVGAEPCGACSAVTVLPVGPRRGLRCSLLCQHGALPSATSCPRVLAVGGVKAKITLVKKEKKPSQLQGCGCSPSIAPNCVAFPSSTVLRFLQSVSSGWWKPGANI